MRPGWIYFFLFCWNASQGRFTSLFLEERSLSEHQIGILLSLNSIVSVFVGPVVSSWSDQLVLRGYVYGHTLVITCCATLTTFFFLCQSLPELHIFEALDNNHLDNRFYYFILIRSLYAMSICPIFSILDGMTLEYLVMMKKEKSLFGNERMFGAISWAIISFTLGIAIDQYATKIMYLYNFCLLFPLLGSLYWYETSKISCVNVLTRRECDLVSRSSKGEHGHIFSRGSKESSGSKIHGSNISMLPTSDMHNIDIATNTDSVDQEDTKIETDIIMDIPGSSLCDVLLKHASVSTCMFLLLCTALSMGTSVVENLVFLMFTDTLGSSNFICGISVVVTVIFEIPLFFYANSMIQFFGPVVLLAISTLAYAIRVVGYTLVPKSANWLILLLEPLHGVTFGCLKIASVEFVSQTAPKGYDVSVQSILGLVKNMGSLVGVGVGGYVEEKFGSHVLYRGSAVIVTLFLVMFVAVFRAEYKQKKDNSSGLIEILGVTPSSRGPSYSKLNLDDDIDTTFHGTITNTTEI